MVQTEDMALHGRLNPHLIENDSRVEHIVRVKQLLELPHEAISLATPLHLNEGSHVPASAMLALRSIPISISGTLINLIAPTLQIDSSWRQEWSSQERLT